MIKKMLIANCGDKGRMALAAKPNRMARAARTGGLDPMEQAHV
jgi:hypothetical protein